ncbi:MAG: metallophosphoesterase [Candidatus Zixiibacteriota bacterium]
MKNQFQIFFSFLVILIVNVFSPLMAQTDQNSIGPIHFAIIGDRTGTAQEGIYEQVVREIERLKPDFVFAVGDMIEGPTSDSTDYINKWNEYFNIVSAFSMPLYYTPGNNDIESDFEEKMYKQVIGDRFYSKDIQGVHFIVLDNARWQNSNDLIANDPDQIKWLINDLESNKETPYILVFYHCPNWYQTIADSQPDTLHNIFVNYGVDAVFNGHFHTYFSGVFDGIKYTTIGSSGGAANPDPTGLLYHFGWVTIDSNGIHIAPIKFNAVLPWDHYTIQQKRQHETISRKGLSFKEPLQFIPIRGDGIHQISTLIVDNSISEYPIDDTLKWEMEDHWNVDNNALPIQVPAGEIKEFEFDFTSHDKCFPLPTASLNFGFSDKEKFNVATTLNVAQMASAHKAKGKINIDGHIDEKFWSDPVERLFNWDGSDMTVEPVQYYFAYDKKNLYIAVHCEDSQIDSLVANVTGHDVPVYGEDCVGFFIEPVFESDTIYQIYFNPLGAIYDAKWWPGSDGYQQGGNDWDGQYNVATTRGDNYWSIEIGIPMDQFGATIKTGDKMRINFRRKHKRLNAAADWQVPLEYNAATYGQLWFIK